jgi:Cysteine-rich CPXCG
MADLVPVTCPSCFEEFEVAAPPLEEIPCEVDYDCEVCCRPMLIRFSEFEGEVVGEAAGLGE